MAEIITEKSNGESKISLTHALTTAVKSALKNIDSAHELNLTIVIDGYIFKNGKYNISIRIFFMNITAEKEKAYQESQKELINRMEVNQNLATQMVAAIYARPIYDCTTPVNALEHRMEYLSDCTDTFDFDTNQDNITLIAPKAFHDQMRVDYKKQFLQDNLTINAPSLDLGGSSAPVIDNKDVA